MRSALHEALIELDQEARETGDPDLVRNVEGVWQILEILCQKINTARDVRDEVPSSPPSKDATRDINT